MNSSKGPSQVIAEKIGQSIPTRLVPIYKKEVELINSGFIVAYHNIPSTFYHGALPIYLFQAYLAELLYGVKLDLLPRFRKPPFLGWSSVSSLTGYIHDHDPKWRAIGISASPSLMSQTESPPYRLFHCGYFFSGAPKPICDELIRDILVDLAFPFSQAQKLSKEIAKKGIDLFNFLIGGGSILQVALHKDVVCDYLFLSSPGGPIKSSGEPMLDILTSVTFGISDQVRVIVHPEIFVNESLSRLYHYPYKKKEI